MEKITLKEFKKFFSTNQAYVKWFNNFTNGKYKVSEMNTNTFTDEVKNVFFAFFTLVNPQIAYAGRVDFIKQWYKAVPGRASRLLKLYGSNSIIYKIKEETLQEETWLRILDCMNKVTLEEHGLAHLIDTNIEHTPIKQLKNEFIDYFTSGKGKNKKEDFNKFIGIDGYTESVINGTRNYAQGIHLEFKRYTGLPAELNVNDELKSYFSKNKEAKLELAGVLYKHLYKLKTTKSFKCLYENPSLLNKGSRTKLLRVIKECKKIYA